MRSSQYLEGVHAEDRLPRLGVGLAIHGHQVKDGLPILPVQPEALLPSGDGDLRHLLAELDPRLIPHCDQLELRLKVVLIAEGSHKQNRPYRRTQGPAVSGT